MSHGSFTRIDEFEMALKIKPMQKKQNEINKQKTNLIIYTLHNPNSSQSRFGCREIQEKKEIISVLKIPLICSIQVAETNK